MVDWARPMKKLRKRLGGRNDTPRPLPLGPGEVAGSQAHLQSLLAGRPPVKAPPNGQIVVAETGLAGLAVEGCMAVPGGGIALRGWLSDPHGRIAGLWLEIDGTLEPARICSRLYRKDVLEQRSMMEAFPAHCTGWFLFEPWDVKPGNETVVHLHAVTETPNGFVVLSSAIAVVPDHNCSLDRLTEEFQAGYADASAVSGAAQWILKGLATTQRRITWRERRLGMASSEPADLAMVIVVKDNVDMLHHLLAVLEAGGHADKLEIILSLQTSVNEQEVNQNVDALRGASFFAAVKTLIPDVPIGVGLAASRGIEIAQSPAIALASDEILPPSGDWAGAALDLLAQYPGGVFIPTIDSFDHRPVTFASVLDMPWTGFEHDHSNLATLAALPLVRKAMAWSSGFLVASRDTINAVGGLDESLSEMDICLFELVYRLQLDGTARLRRLPGAFTHLRLPPFTASDRVQRLWSLYALAENVRRRVGETEEDRPGAPPDSGASPRQGATRSGHATGS